MLYVFYYLVAQSSDTFAITINIIWFLDFIWFLIGSAYFVAGSYPIVEDFAHEGRNEDQPRFLLDNLDIDTNSNNNNISLLSAYPQKSDLKR